MLRLLCPLLAGIILAINLQFPIPFLPIILLALFLVSFFLILNQNLNQNYHKRWMHGAGISLTLLVLGLFVVQQNWEQQTPSHFSNRPYDLLLARVTEEHQEKEKTWKLQVQVHFCGKTGSLEPSMGKILIYLSKKQQAQTIPNYGDWILIRQKAKLIPPPSNPGTFDYRQYMATQSVYHQLFLETGKWKLLPCRSTSDLKGISIQVKSYLLKRMAESNIGGKEYAVAAALILGQDDWLDYETRSEFSHSGVVHILGISGLHVGILYLVLNFVLSFLNKKPRHQLIKTIIILLIIWFYALITGLSPAALRAATMFSFVLLGKLGDRNMHIINALAASAFFLLVFDPYLVTNIGFLFSYLAVLGIVLMHEPLYSIIEFRWKWMDKIWSLIAMTLVAQISTVPITLYFFHQFPTYFLPANLLVIPLSNLIIYSGMAILIFSFIPIISGFFGLITSWMLKLLFLITSVIDKLPFALIQPVYIGMPQLLLLYALIVSAIVFIHTKHKLALFAAFAFLLFALAVGSVHKIKAVEQQKIMAFSINKHTAIAWIKGTDCLITADTGLLSNQKLMEQTVLPGLIELGVKNIEYSGLFKPYFSEKLRLKIDTVSCGSYTQFGQSRNFILYQLPDIPAGKRKIQLDNLFITGNIYAEYKKLNTAFMSSRIILDCSNSAFRCNKWQESVTENSVEMINLRDEGALMLDIY
ncbi:MAG: ComEC family competence protein [Bacteroidales bacterium]|nr:ComEC family competence protein [Bacteroidales bacterium]